MAYTRTMYRIVNPAAGDDYFTNGAAAFDAKADFTDSKNPALQPTINSGRSKKLYSNRTLLNAVGEGYLRRNNGSLVVAGNNIGSAAWATSIVAVTSVAGDGTNGFCKYTLNSHSLVVGNIIIIYDANSKVGGVQRVTAVDTNTFTTTKRFVAGAGTLNYRLSAGNFATMTAGSYVMRRYCSTLAGVAKTVLRSGAADPTRRRSIHAVYTVRTVKVTTAIRAGYWNPVTASWSTAPTVANDGLYSISASSQKTDGTADEAATPTLAKPGELVYKEPKPLPNQADYKARTTW